MRKIPTCVLSCNALIGEFIKKAENFQNRSRTHQSHHDCAPRVKYILTKIVSVDSLGSNLMPKIRNLCEKCVRKLGEPGKNDQNLKNRRFEFDFEPIYFL